ncbi:hypothetical protein RND71_004284 [Anisodus tanguticus]|uniref:AAA+ ATPase At3g28540-like C-terminal domain-containing protein n=1 Tax=Anisodus tanguticus TaxID=243964 RepID=A0AAE1SYE0_9SOLA|nr:hypothetical protein RND71_004284 [Anisodus tanguticus]
MANYLNFDLYDLELTEIKKNSDLRGLLLATANNTILVVEDIDCTIDLQDKLGNREADDDSPSTKDKEGNKLLVANYLGGIRQHKLFEEIEELIGKTAVTPAEVAEQLMKEDEVSLKGLMDFLNTKWKEQAEAKNKEEEKG